MTWNIARSLCDSWISCNRASALQSAVLW